MLFSTMQTVERTLIITVKPCIEITRIFFTGEKSGKRKIIDVNILFSMRQEVEDIEIDFLGARVRMCVVC